MVGDVGVALMSDNSLWLKVSQLLFPAKPADSSSKHDKQMSCIVECRSFMSPAQSASENPVKLLSTDLSYFSPKFTVTFK